MRSISGGTLLPLPAVVGSRLRSIGTMDLPDGRMEMFRSIAEQIVRDKSGKGFAKRPKPPRTTVCRCWRAAS